MAGNDLTFGKIYNLSGGESITLEGLGRLMLDRLGEAKPFLHLPVPLCRALAQVLTLAMKDPPLTPYAVAGFTNHADLDCADAVRDLGYRPRGVRAGIEGCFSRRAPV
jgi:nucleoside-diphosphate-sugar epimerase